MRHRWLDGLALGIAVGFIVASAIYWLLDETSGVVEQYIAEHVTHVVTLAAAALALFGVSTQIQSNFKAMEGTRLAKLDAAKATLPIVLSNISRLCEERYFNIAFGEQQPAEGMKWKITDFELTTLKECIEHSEGFEKELMQDIIRVYQVLNSRWETLEFERIFGTPDIPEGDPRMLDRHNQFSAISNWAALRAIATSLFAYSRGASSNPSYENMKDDVLHTMRRMHTGGLTGDGGSALTNNGDFRRFVERREASRNIAFLDDDWED